MKYVLYSTDCPMCKVLHLKLTSAGVDFAVERDQIKIMEIAERYHMYQAPLFQIDESTILDFKGSLKWLDNLKKESK